MLLILTSFPVSAHGETPTDEYGFGFMATTEPAMPIVSLNAGDARTQSAGNTLAVQREIWLDQIIEYNEIHFEQAVTSVVEDSEKYTLYFAPKEIPYENRFIASSNLSIIEKIPEEQWGISMIEYLKPEAIHHSAVETPMQTNSTITVGERTYDYKFTYYYAYTQYTQYKSKSFLSYLSIAADATLAFTVDGLSKLVTWIIGRCVGDAFASFEQNMPVTVASYNMHYYENKVCSVKPVETSFWYPTCQIGRRLTFAYGWTSVQENSSVPPTLYVMEPPQPNGTPPTNYTSYSTKNYYYNNTWMINKAIETMTTGGYADVYAVCTNIRPG